MELVSILIPNYNYGHYIAQALDSALSQTYPETEIIVTDNCSTDDSVKIVKEYAAKHERVKLYVNDTNIGIVGNHNKVLELSSGEYVVILSSDDFLDERFVEKCMEKFRQYPTAGIVATDRFSVDAENNVTIYPSFYERSFFCKGIYHNRVLLMADPFAPSQVLIKKSCLLDPLVGTFSEAVNTFLDTDLWFRLGMRYDVVFINEKLAYYRFAAGSYSKSYDTFQYIFERYLLRLRFIRMADGDSYLSQHFQETLERIPHACVRMVKQILDMGNFKLAKRYLRLTEALDDRVAEFPYYELAEQACRDGKFEYDEEFRRAEMEYLASLKRDDSAKKQAPYEVPEGAEAVGEG